MKKKTGKKNTGNVWFHEKQANSKIKGIDDEKNPASIRQTRYSKGTYVYNFPTWEKTHVYRYKKQTKHQIDKNRK